jgi:hypothetical protein
MSGVIGYQEHPEELPYRDLLAKGTLKTRNEWMRHNGDVYNLGEIEGPDGATMGAAWSTTNPDVLHLNDGMSIYRHEGTLGKPSYAYVRPNKQKNAKKKHVAFSKEDLDKVEALLQNHGHTEMAEKLDKYWQSCNDRHEAFYGLIKAADRAATVADKSKKSVKAALYTGDNVAAATAVADVRQTDEAINSLAEQLAALEVPDYGEEDLETWNDDKPRAQRESSFGLPSWMKSKKVEDDDDERGNYGAPEELPADEEGDDDEVPAEADEEEPGEVEEEVILESEEEEDE